jgi:hypothetical protein
VIEAQQTNSVVRRAAIPWPTGNGAHNETSAGKAAISAARTAAALAIAEVLVIGVVPEVGEVLVIAATPEFAVELVIVALRVVVVWAIGAARDRSTTELAGRAANASAIAAYQAAREPVAVASEAVVPGVSVEPTRVRAVVADLRVWVAVAAAVADSAVVVVVAAAAVAVAAAAVVAGGNSHEREQNYDNR